MSLIDLAQQIGTVGLLRIERFEMAVTVRDIKTAYGRVRYLVEPVSGSGCEWVDSERLSL
jgi:hypothetical protein